MPIYLENTNLNQNENSMIGMGNHAAGGQLAYFTPRRYSFLKPGISAKEGNYLEEREAGLLPNEAVA